MKREVSQDALKKAYRATFGSGHGKDVLEDLRRAAGIGRQSYVPGDAMETIFRDGKKSMIYLIEQHLDGERDEPKETSEETEESP